MTRWFPLISAVTYFIGILVWAGTSIADIAAFGLYAALAVMLPGTLVYRALRRSALTLAEDLAMGAAVGLVLELAAWALFSALDLRSWVAVWPLLVIVPFAAIPRLRRHWWVTGYERAPLGWSWSVALIVAFWTTYLSSVFLQRNPILPTSGSTRQYLDLAYQLSLAGEAKNHIPPGLPQAAGEPLYYHWFGYSHMAMTSMVGGIDLAAVSLRFVVPALCALAILLTAVVGWRLSKRAAVGAIAAALFFAIGEFNFTDPVTMPFGTQATFVIWHGMSMTYSWVLLLALIGVAGAILAGETRMGMFVLAALLLLASTGAKSSTLPVVIGALAVAALTQLIMRRKIPWATVLLGLMAVIAQFLAVAVLYRFNTYGTALKPFTLLEGFYAGQGWLVTAGVFLGFFLNMGMRLAGIIPLLWRSWRQMLPVQWFLLGGTVAGFAACLLLDSVGGAQVYFARSGFAFGVILSAWGFVEVLDRARLTKRGHIVLAIGAAQVALALIVVQFVAARWQPKGHPYSPVIPIWQWAALLFGIAACTLFVWHSLPKLTGKGGVVLLTFVLIAGAPGLIMDMRKSERVPNGGAYHNIAMPLSRVEAARWVRDHSNPDDVLVTNVHCLNGRQAWCDSRSFWLSAYSERRVLVEGWGFAPRTAGVVYPEFWDQDLLRRNDDAIDAPTAEELARLRDEHRVRWVVVDTLISLPSSELAQLADVAYDNGRIMVFRIRTP